MHWDSEHISKFLITMYQLGSTKSMLGLYYLPSVFYYDNYHRPYAILAIIILLSLQLYYLWPNYFYSLSLQPLPKLSLSRSHQLALSLYLCWLLSWLLQVHNRTWKIDCPWFQTVMLSLINCFIIFGLTLSTIELLHVYAIIVLTIFYEHSTIQLRKALQFSFS